MSHRWASSTPVSPHFARDVIRMRRQYNINLVRLSPSDALQTSSSQEIISYLNRSMFALEQPQHTNTHAYGLIDTAYGTTLLVDKNQPEGIATFERQNFKISLFLIGAG